MAELDKIVRSADAERDRSLTMLAQLIESEKQQLRNINNQLNQLPLNEIPKFIRQVKSDLQYLNENNDTFFNVTSKAPQITIQQQRGFHTRNWGQKAASLLVHSDEEWGE